MNKRLMRTMFWTIIIGWITIILGLITIFETRKVVEPEVVVTTELVYVYKEADLPKEFIAEEPELISEIPPKYGFTEDEIYLMTVLLSGSGKTDGDGEYDIDFGNKDNHDQISLVLSVIMNRVMSNKFSNTVAEVIWAPGQFALMPRWKQGLPKVSDESHQVVKEWCESYDAHDLSVMSIPESHLYFAGNGVTNRSRERW